MSAQVVEQAGKTRELRVGDRVRVPEKPAPFKVGDKVRCIRGDDQYTLKAGIKVGDVGAVTEVTHDGTVSNVSGYSIKVTFGTEAAWNLRPEHFEREKSEVENLVEKANAGLAALGDLVKNHNHEAQQISASGTVLDDCGHWYDLHQYRFQVKPAPEPKTLKPFAVQGWNVELKGEALHIGCQVFNAKELLKYLQKAVVESRSDNGLGFVPSRTGLYYDTTGDTLTWESAEKILDALKEVLG